MSVEERAELARLRKLAEAAFYYFVSVQSPQDLQRLYNALAEARVMQLPRGTDSL